MTKLTVSKQGGDMVLEGAGPASLDTSMTMRKGTISADGESIPVHAHNHVRSEVTAGDDKAPLIRLAPGGSEVPGGAADWTLDKERGEFVGVLSRGDARMELRMSRMKGSTIEVTVNGEWDRLEAVVLTASFAMLARRRGEKMRAVAISGGPGPADI
jgi:hypothetical protein